MYWKERYTLVNYHLNKDGLCDAFISWSVVNRFGKNDKKGEYIYVDEFWKHKNINFKTILRDFINKMKKHDTGNVKYIYWNRRKYDLDNDQDSLRIYRRDLAERI